MCRARDLLLEEREYPLSIKDLAQEVRVSPFHLIRQFEAVFGVTPHQFRLASRLDLAKHLLATGQHSVTEVCMEVGFSSLGSFSVLFTAPRGRDTLRLSASDASDGARARDCAIRSDTGMSDADGPPAGLGDLATPGRNFREA